MHPKRTPKTTAVVALVIALLASSSPESRSASLYAEISHASNAGATDRNLGRNFVHLGWAFDNGLMISAGTYFVGEEYCFKSATLGQKFGGGLWQVSLTAHEGGRCTIDNQSVLFEPNYGLCVGRDIVARTRWQVALGGCVWRQADYSTGNPVHPDYPLSTADEGHQLTAMILVRVRAWTRKTE